jgi:hypothetical protein
MGIAEGRLARRASGAGVSLPWFAPFALLSFMLACEFWMARNQVK